MKKTILHLLIMHGIIAQALAQGTATQQTDKEHGSLRGLYSSNDRANDIRAKLPLPGLLGQQGLASITSRNTAANKVPKQVVGAFRRSLRAL